MRRVGGVLLCMLALAGCSASTDATTPVTASTTRLVIQSFTVYTHCGIREVRIGNDFYAAAPVLSVGGNPPAGWGNPWQKGTMTVFGNGTARFTASGGLLANFKIRPFATAMAGPPCD